LRLGSDKKESEGFIYKLLRNESLKINSTKFKKIRKSSISKKKESKRYNATPLP